MGSRRFLLQQLLANKVVPPGPTPQLLAPTISLSNDNLTVEQVESARYYDIYIDGTLNATISGNTPENSITDNSGEYIITHSGEFIKTTEE